MLILSVISYYQLYYRELLLLCSWNNLIKMYYCFFLFFFLTMRLHLPKNASYLWNTLSGGLLTWNKYIEKYSSTR